MLFLDWNSAYWGNFCRKGTVFSTLILISFSSITPLTKLWCFQINQAPRMMMELPMFFFHLHLLSSWWSAISMKKNQTALLTSWSAATGIMLTIDTDFFNLYFEWIYYLNCSFLFSVKLVAIGDMSDHVQILVLACATLVSVIRIADHHLAYWFLVFLCTDDFTNLHFARSFE